MTDALQAMQGLARHRVYKYLLPLFFLFPIIGNAISRLSKHGWWLNDFDALSCGANHLRQGLSPYGLTPVCAGLRPAVDVYAPQIGQAFAPFISLFSLTGTRWAYLVVLLPMMALLVWYAILKPMDRAPRILRLMTLAAMAGSAMACGNIGLVLHGLVILAALNIKQSRWPFLIAVTLAALIKPVCLTYLIVLLYEDRAVLARLRTTLIAVCVGLSGFIALLLTAGPFAQAWQQALSVIVIHEQPGIGFFSFTSLVGLSTTSPLTLAGFAIFALIIAGSGLILAEWSGLSGFERIVLGLGVAQLLNPRLMDYDMLALAPGMALVVMCSRSLGDRIFYHVSWAFAGTLIADVVVNILEIGLIHRAPVTIFIYCGLLVYVAALTARPHMARVKAWLRNPLPVLQDILAQRI